MPPGFYCKEGSAKDNPVACDRDHECLGENNPPHPVSDEARRRRAASKATVAGAASKKTRPGAGAASTTTVQTGAGPTSGGVEEAEAGQRGVRGMLSKVASLFSRL